MFRNNIIREINGGNAALEVGQNSIARENIIGGYSGNQGHVGILIREGSDQTIRNNKVGGFTANVVLIGTKPTFSRNSFIGNLNRSGSGQFNVVVGNNNVNINDSVRYDIGFWGWGYNGDPETISMRNISGVYLIMKLKNQSLTMMTKTREEATSTLTTA